MTSERIEFLSQFDDYALASMANEGYRLEDDTLMTCTTEELEAVKQYRLENFAKWAEKNPFAELESFTQGETVIEVKLRIYGGASHTERVDVANDYLSAMNSEGYVVSCDRYETTQKKDGEGHTYTEFLFTCSPNN